MAPEQVEKLTKKFNIKPCVVSLTRIQPEKVTMKNSISEPFSTAQFLEEVKEGYLKINPPSDTKYREIIILKEISSLEVAHVKLKKASERKLGPAPRQEKSTLEKLHDEIISRKKID